MGIHSCSICGDSNPGRLHVLELHSMESSKCAAFCSGCVSDENWKVLESLVTKKAGEFKKAYMQKMAFKKLPDLFTEEDCQ
jgi:hypothetical protein